MVHKPETIFKKKILINLRSIPNSWWESINQIATRGTPDIVGCINGHFVAIELKSSIQGKTTKLQQFKINEIRRVGGFAFVMNPSNSNDIFKSLNDLAEVKNV